MPTLDLPRPGLADISGIYLRGEDNLRVSSFGALAGCVLAVDVRFTLPDGTIVPGGEVHTPNSDRSLKQTLIPTAEGWLSNVEIRATTGAPLAGQVFVLVEVVRGSGATVIPLGVILAGYVSSVGRLVWPGMPHRLPVDGPGMVRLFLGADPAANVECSDAVPTGARWRLWQWFVTLVTDANAANRTVTLVIDDGANVLYQVDASGTQAASLTRSYEAAPTGVAADASGNVFRLPIPAPIWLPAGARIRTSTANRQVGDNFGAPLLLVEEWIAG